METEDIRVIWAGGENEDTKRNPVHLATELKITQQAGDLIISATNGPEVYFYINSQGVLTIMICGRGTLFSVVKETDEEKSE